MKDGRAGGLLVLRPNCGGAGWKAIALERRPKFGFVLSKSALAEGPLSLAQGRKATLREAVKC